MWEVGVTLKSLHSCCITQFLSLPPHTSLSPSPSLFSLSLSLSSLPLSFPPFSLSTPLSPNTTVYVSIQDDSTLKLELLFYIFGAIILAALLISIFVFCCSICVSDTSGRY